MRPQVSTPSHALPSLQRASLAVLVQDLVASLQASTVQLTPSSQGEPEPAVQPVPAIPFGGSHFSVPSQ